MYLLKVGLTGGIGCGKTVVAGMFEELGAVILDADRIAAEVLKKGREGYDEAVSVFGNDILDTGGEIDRKKLSRIVFENESDRRKLNAIVHPLVRKRERAIWNRVVKPAVVITDAALIIETGGVKRFDKIIVVYCRREQQEKRLVERGMDGLEINRRIDSQMPAEEKKRYADYVIDNTGTLDETRGRVRRIFVELKQILKEGNDDK